MIDLASPPIAKASGVPGLALDDYCSINTSLKTLHLDGNMIGDEAKAALRETVKGRDGFHLGL